MRLVGVNFHGYSPLKVQFLTASLREFSALKSSLIRGSFLSLSCLQDAAKVRVHTVLVHGSFLKRFFFATDPRKEKAAPATERYFLYALIPHKENGARWFAPALLRLPLQCRYFPRRALKTG